MLLSKMFLSILVSSFSTVLDGDDEVTHSKKGKLRSRVYGFQVWWVLFSALSSDTFKVVRTRPKIGKPMSRTIHAGTSSGMGPAVPNRSRKRRSMDGSR